MADPIPNPTCKSNEELGFCELKRLQGGVYVLNFRGTNSHRYEYLVPNENTNILAWSPDTLPPNRVVSGVTSMASYNDFVNHDLSKTFKLKS